MGGSRVGASAFGKSHDYVTPARQVGRETRQSPVDVIEREEMMETFAAIVLTAVFVPVLFLAIIVAIVLVAVALSFL
jgi:hypothetical protein